MLICEEDEWILKLKKLTELLLSQKRNILGICFGHQLLGIIMGGKVTKFILFLFYSILHISD